MVKIFSRSNNSSKKDMDSATATKSFDRLERSSKKRSSGPWKNFNKTFIKLGGDVFKDLTPALGDMIDENTGDINDLKDKYREKADDVAKSLGREEFKLEDVKNTSLKELTKIARDITKSGNRADDEKFPSFKDEDFALESSSLDTDGEGNQILTQYYSVSSKDSGSVATIATTITGGFTSLIDVNSQGFSSVLSGLQTTTETDSDFYQDTISSLGKLSEGLGAIQKNLLVTSQSDVRSSTALEDLLLGNLTIGNMTAAIGDRLKKEIIQRRKMRALSSPYEEISSTISNSSWVPEPIKKIIDMPKQIGLNIFDYINEGKIEDSKFVKSLKHLRDEAPESENWFIKNVFGSEKANEILKKIVGPKSADGQFESPITRLLRNIVVGSDLQTEGVDVRNRIRKSAKVNFDAESHNSLTTVIPGYLARILSNLTGEEMIVNDYDTGKWMTASAARNKVADRERRTLGYNDQLERFFLRNFDNGEEIIGHSRFSHLIYEITMMPDFEVDDLATDKISPPNRELAHIIYRSILDSTDPKTVNEFRRALLSGKIEVSRDRKDPSRRVSGSMVNAFNQDKDEVRGTVDPIFPQGSSASLSSSSKPIELTPALDTAFASIKAKFSEMIEMLDTRPEFPSDFSSPTPPTDSVEPSEPTDRQVNESTDPTPKNTSFVDLSDKFKDKLSETKIPKSVSEAKSKAKEWIEDTSGDSSSKFADLFDKFKDKLSETKIPKSVSEAKSKAGEWIEDLTGDSSSKWSELTGLYRLYRLGLVSEKLTPISGNLILDENGEILSDNLSDQISSSQGTRKDVTRSAEDNEFKKIWKRLSEFLTPRKETSEPDSGETSFSESLSEFLSSLKGRRDESSSIDKYDIPDTAQGRLATEEVVVTDGESSASPSFLEDLLGNITEGSSPEDGSSPLGNFSERIKGSFSTAKTKAGEVVSKNPKLSSMMSNIDLQAKVTTLWESVSKLPQTLSFVAGKVGKKALLSQLFKTAKTALPALLKKVVTVLANPKVAIPLIVGAFAVKGIKKLWDKIRGKRAEKQEAEFGEEEEENKGSNGLLKNVLGLVVGLGGSLLAAPLKGIGKLLGITPEKLSGEAYHNQGQVRTKFNPFNLFGNKEEDGSTAIPTLGDDPEVGSTPVEASSALPIPINDRKDPNVQVASAADSTEDPTDSSSATTTSHETLQEFSETSLYNEFNESPKKIARKLLGFTPMGAAHTMYDEGFDPANPRSSVASNIKRWMEDITKKVEATMAASFTAATGGGGGGSTSGGDTSMPDVELSGPLQDQFWDFFTAAGFSPAAVAGMMGNIQHESGFKPSAKEQGGPAEGYGLIQWSYGRKQAYFAYAKKKGKPFDDFKTQLEYLLIELNNGGHWMANPTYIGGTYPYSEFKTTKDPQRAAESFCWAFERPAPSTANINGRKRYAQSFFDKYSNRKSSTAEKADKEGDRLATKSARSSDSSSSSKDSSTTVDTGGRRRGDSTARRKDEKKPVYPVNRENNVITSSYGKRARPTAGASVYHWAIDLAPSKGPANPPIYATQDGIVQFAGGYGTGGNAIIIQHTGDGYWSRYLHLNSFKVKVGQVVTAGQEIAIMGNTGVGTATHLDFAVSKSDSWGRNTPDPGDTIDPVKYLEGSADAIASSASSGGSLGDSLGGGFSVDEIMELLEEPRPKYLIDWDDSKTEEVYERVKDKYMDLFGFDESGNRESGYGIENEELDLIANSLNVPFLNKNEVGKSSSTSGGGTGSTGQSTYTPYTINKEGQAITSRPIEIKDRDGNIIDRVYITPDGNLVHKDGTPYAGAHVTNILNNTYITTLLEPGSTAEGNLQKYFEINIDALDDLEEVLRITTKIHGNTEEAVLRLMKILELLKEQSLLVDENNEHSEETIILIKQLEATISYLVTGSENTNINEGSPTWKNIINGLRGIQETSPWSGEKDITDSNALLEAVLAGA